MGAGIPKALRDHLNLPVEIEYHQLHFAQAEPDDVWLPQVGNWGWTVIGQDYKYHLMPSEQFALKQHQIGVFYIWGSQATRWDTMRVFAKAYDKIVDAAGKTARPFIYRVYKNGHLAPVKIP